VDGKGGVPNELPAILQLFPDGQLAASQLP
jgi:hypothetical protein